MTLKPVTQESADQYYLGSRPFLKESELAITNTLFLWGEGRAGVTSLFLFPSAYESLSFYTASQNSFLSVILELPDS